MTDPILLAVGAALGLVIGMLGGGGGILAVPLLVAIGQPVLAASTMSLVVVGTGAAAALVPHHRAQRVEWRVGATFGALGAVGAVAGARLATVLSPAALLVGLSLLLVAGAVTMLRTGLHLRSHALDDADHTHDPATRDVPGPLLDAPALHDPPAPGPAGAPDGGVRITPLVVLLATVVGLVTGLFGVGAGFVVVPALVAALHLPVKKATATALVVIVINCSVALVVRHDSLADARSTFELALMTALFAVLGAVLSRRVPGWVLSMAFGTLMLGVAVVTVWKTATVS